MDISECVTECVSECGDAEVQRCRGAGRSNLSPAVCGISQSHAGAWRLSGISRLSAAVDMDRRAGM